MRSRIFARTIFLPGSPMMSPMKRTFNEPS
jgi:hypothetical protein